MYTCSYPVNTSDLPTAVKSRYYSYSPPTIIDNSSKMATKYHTKIHETKNDLNTMITEMVNKKQDNLNALERIKATNT
jgi:hypothetical protein